jgi:hypothetical protein
MNKIFEVRQKVNQLLGIVSGLDLIYHDQNLHLTDTWL